MPEIRGKTVIPTSGKQYIISDVHGCFQTLKALIQKINLQSNDQIFFLGDYVHKGPSGLRVLDTIIDLSKNHQVFCLLGNHDLNFLRCIDEGIDIENSDIALLKKLSANHQKVYTDLIRTMNHYIILGDYILVHAGLNFDLSNPFESLEDLISIRNFEYNSSKAHFKTIVHGHVPHELLKIKAAINSKSKIIPLDNGCVYADRYDMGRLLCLELNRKNLIIQENIELK